MTMDELPATVYERLHDAHDVYFAPQLIKVIVTSTDEAKAAVTLVGWSRSNNPVFLSPDAYLSYLPGWAVSGVVAFPESR